MNCADQIGVGIGVGVVAVGGAIIFLIMGSIDFFKWRKPESLRNLLDDRDALRRDVKHLREKLYFMEVELSRHEDRVPPPAPPGINL